MIKIVEGWAKEHGYDICKYGVDPRIVILGEEHLDSHCQRKQKILFQHLESEILAHEFVGNNIFDFSTRKLYENPLFPIPASAFDFAASDVAAPLDLLNEDERLIAWLNENGFDCSLTDYEKSFLALAYYGNFGKFLDLSPSTLRLIVGADLSKAEERLYEKEHNLSLTGEFGDCSREHQFAREQRMAEAIAWAILQTDKPVVTVLGNYHIQAESYIHTQLQERGIGYVCIDQFFRR